VKSKFFILTLVALLYSNILANGDTKVLASTNSYAIVEYTPDYNIENLDQDENGLKQVYLVDGLNVNEQFTSQFREFVFGTPSLNGNTVTLIATEKKVINGTLQHNGVEQQESEMIQDEILLPGNSGKVREMNVTTARVFPIKYDLEKKEITLYTKVVFRVNFGAVKGSFAPVKEPTLYEGVLQNFAVAKNWGTLPDALPKINNKEELSTGTWYRFETPDEGIYKITRDELSSLGINADNVDPRDIQIFSSGGLQLSETPGDYKTFAEKEIPIYISGESDGKFDSGDFILFYGRNVDFWRYDDNANQVIRNRHQYSKKNYYFITVGNSGKRMDETPSLTSTNPQVQNTTEAFEFFEENTRNLYKTGRVFVGDEYSQTNNNHTYITSLQNLIQGESIRYNYSFVNNSTISRPLFIDENGERLFTGTAFGNSSTYGWGRVNTGSIIYSGSLPDNRSALKFTFNTNTPAINGYMDYFEIRYTASLSANEDYISFFSEKTGNDIRFEIGGFTNTDIHIFDVSDYLNVKKISGASLSGGEAKFTAAGNTDYMNKYIAVCTSKFKSVSGAAKIENSQISGPNGDAEYIVITPRILLEQANRLANYRSVEAKYPLTSEIVTIEDVFNYYNFGVVDPTALRNFLYEAYNYRAAKPTYLLLFGDGDYDYFDTEGYGTNYIPSFHTLESMHEVNAYPTDDYFARVSGDDLFIDLAHGRIPANTLVDAEIFVDKIIKYETNLEKGIWRNKITLVADDQNTNDSSTEYFHTTQSETLSTSKLPSYFDQQKIYLAAYPTVNTGSGRRKPSVNQAIIDAINNGTLMLNFIGHGNPDTWTHEYVFERASTLPLINNEDYFFLTAATCDFGRYDDPAKTSASEEMLFMRDKGMIGSFSATRAVFSNLNAALNNALYNYLFLATPEVYPHRVGYAYMQAKTVSSLGTDENSEKFHIFTDPALILNEPLLPGEITKVNDEDLTSSVQLKALQSASISGVVYEENNVGTRSGFNGEAIITVYDSDKQVELKELNYREIQLPGGVIFRGRASVSNGQFSAAFTVPKDITYENKNGKIVVYFFNNETDGIGYTNKIIVGGTDTTVANDGAGPSIEIFFDELDQSGAYLVNEDFTLLVRLEDETGLNTTGTGVGHKLEGVLDNSSENSFDLTNYFIGDLDAAGKSGVIKYNVSSMEPGDHSIKVNAWDVFNNFSTDEAYFTVVSSGGLVLRDVVNYPNPFSGQTHFTFQHNYSSPVNVKIKIYTIAGRLIREIEQSAISDKFVRVYWDGRDQDGDLIANGTYLYKLIVGTTDGQGKENFLGKLTVIR